MALGITGDSEGIGCLEQALAIRREIGDRMGEAQAANNLADAYQRLGRADEALDLLRRALDLNRQVGNRYGEGVALVNLGSVCWTSTAPRRPLTACNRPGAPSPRSNTRMELATPCTGSGAALLSLGRDAEALDCLHQALASHQAAGNRHRQAVTLRFLGRAQARTGLAAEARESWTQAAAIFDDLGDSVQAAEVRAEQDTSGISMRFASRSRRGPIRCCGSPRIYPSGPGAR